MHDFVLLNNSQTGWPTKIVMQFLSFSDNLLEDAYIMFQKKKQQQQTNGLMILK